MYSVTQGSNIAIFAGVIVMILSHFNVTIASDDIVTVLSAVVAIIGVVTSFINRYKKGDVTALGAKI